MDLLFRIGFSVFIPTTSHCFKRLSIGFIANGRGTLTELYSIEWFKDEVLVFSEVSPGVLSTKIVYDRTPWGLQDVFPFSWRDKSFFNPATHVQSGCIFDRGFPTRLQWLWVSDIISFTVRNLMLFSSSTETTQTPSTRGPRKYGECPDN